ncbi:MAG: hypothetical protein M1819_003782 [Sarea resinae]|nr:MAG: hypothetical protein M1819_003782 [Sarea resinae]
MPRTWKPDPLAVPSWRTATAGPPIPNNKSYSTAQQDRLWEDSPNGNLAIPNDSQPREAQHPGSHPRTAHAWKPHPQAGGGQHAPAARGAGRGRGGPPLSGAQEILARRPKRKETSPAPPRPAQRARHGPPLDLMDEPYIRRHFKIPTAAEYPGAPQNLAIQPQVVLRKVGGGALKIKGRVTTLPRGNFKYNITCQIPDREPVIVHGEGNSQKAAEKAAFLRLLADFHESGILKEIFHDDPSDEEVDQQTLQDEADAKTDIYNYAARFDLVPQLTVRPIFRPFRARGKKLIEVSIELPDQGIKVAGRALNLKAAEVGASIRFKQEAEKYHAEHGDSSLVIKDSTTINSSNVKKFFEFYQIHHKDAKFETDTKRVTGLKQFGSIPYRSQVLMNGEPIGEPVDMIAQKKAEELAYLTAAIALKKMEPDLHHQFARALQAGNGEILKPIPPITMPVDMDCVLVMRETLYETRTAGLPDEAEEILSDEELEENRRVRPRPKLSPAAIQRKNETLLQKHQKYLEDPKLEEMRKKREELPMNHYRAKVIDIVENNTYSIIVGATGSGKTTQVPQILLEHATSAGSGAACNVVCTQPRRIAAISVANRVANERNEPLQNSIGYQVRFDSKIPQAGGSVLYCTTGILLKQLQSSPDEILDGTSHLIIDEVHERDILIDFLLIILKKVMTDRIKIGKHVPKVVLMSATMDTELFAGYFKQTSPHGKLVGCPSLSVPGRTFPVQENYLDGILETLNKSYSKNELQVMNSDPPTREFIAFENAFRSSLPSSNQGTATPEEAGSDAEATIDWKRERILSAEGEMAISNEKEDACIPFGLIATIIAHITKVSEEGAILVFLPGLDEILKVDDILRRLRPLGVDFKDESKFKLQMLHSSIPAGQTDVFNPVAKGCRKVILATNIAETSITIPDVQYVVDSGKLREKRYDQIRRITKLQCTWVSKSNSKQRAGRAGRVQNGNYYALFSKPRYESLRAIGLPEMLRSDLQEICLDIKAQAFKAPIRDFLAEAIEPPSAKAVDASVNNLQALEALTEDEKLTPLGRLLASLPVHPSLGKMIVLGVLFRCLDPMLILASGSSDRSLFVSPIDARRQATEARLAFVEGTGSDHIAMINAFREMRRIREEKGQGAMVAFAHQNFIHMGVFKLITQVAKQIEEILVEAKLIPYTPIHERYNYEFGPPDLNRFSSKIPLIKTLALAGLYPNLAVNAGGRSFRTPGEKGCMVHPSSINYLRSAGTFNNSHASEEDNKHPYGTLFAYSTMARSNDGRQTFLRDTSTSTPLMATLFGGRLRNPSRNILEMDGWLPFYVRGDDTRAVKTIVEFRKALDRLLTGAFRDLRDLGKPQGGRWGDRSRMQREKRGGFGGASWRNGNANGYDNESDDGQGPKYLADEKARDLFSQGLVEVLDRDVRVREGIARRGWRRQ